MKLKGLMLGVAAAATATTAQAADLPVAPEPVDYVRVCDAYGARFYYIPGTETCLRVGGRVRVQANINNVIDDGNWANRDSNGTSTLARGYVYLDARTATEFGTLRAYAGLRMDRSNGANGFKLDAGYIQWGGLTAGFLGSVANIYTGQAYIGSITRNWGDSTTNQINYTAAFGNGFYATVGLEDRLDRQQGTYTLITSTTVGGVTANDASTESIYGGSRMPNLVAAIGVSQGWGGAKAIGALQQITPNAVINGVTGDAEDKLGWAVGAGVDVNLPFGNPGSNIFFQGFYADGAMSYIGSNFARNAGSFTVADFGIDANGGTDTTSGWSLSSGVYIQATPTIGLALDGSYMDVDVGGDGTGGVAFTSQGDITRWALDASVVWTPVSGLEIGADVGYADTDFDDADDVEDLVFGLRMQRTF